MKALDTNVLVRYLTQDEPRQAAIAAEQIEQAAARDEKMLIQPLVLCELVWVLETAYDFGKADILGVLDQIVRTRQFEVTDKDTVWHALAEYRHAKGDFSDYYLGRANERDGAPQTLTFDKALKGNPRFRVLAA
ncbi:MAG TPA: type II toxin-antitoxin system VapC family toxin [Candidatus Methylomirabilis sp.]|nr:type II toxin-antitoxin system VapC family toxin [Candidatus Methylomirabilis sp.]HSC70933.1 type II toxin-antitoxin system VapC family toxin [Candidatus Methylomirabilis sp.]